MNWWGGCFICCTITAMILLVNGKLPIDTEDDRTTHYDEHGALIVPMADQHVIDLYTKWIEQSLSSVISVLATKELKNVHYEMDRKEFAYCSKKAKNVHLHAKCLDQLWAKGGKKVNKLKKRRELKSLKPRLLRYKNQKQWIGPFRTRQKRSISVKSAKDYTIKSTRHEGSSPLGFVARGLLKAVLTTKNRTRVTRWQEVVEQAQRIQKTNDELQEDPIINRPRGRNQLFKGIKFPSNDEFVNDDPIENQLDYRPPFSTDRLPPTNSNVMNRIFDFKQDSLNDVPEFPDTNSEKPAKEKMSRRLMNLLEDGVKLGYSLAGANSTELNKKDSMRFVSPRFLSVMPEREDPENKTLEFMSPSLFSLHSNGHGIENLTSLPNLFREFTGDDQQAWLDLILESSGVNDQLEKLEERFKKIDMSPNAKLLKDSLQRYKDEVFTKDGQPLYFTKDNVTRIYGKFGERRIDHWITLQKTFTKEQINELNTTGMATMSPKQLELIYGASSPFNDSSSLERLHKFISNSSKSEINELIRQDLKTLASADEIKIRKKRDIVLSPITFTVISNGVSFNNPIILSPLFFAPLINEFTILGPLILSPWVFVPLVLSPKLMSPIIVSPFLFSPTILSPYALHPTILSPGAFSPFILTPLLLAPGILSPLAFSPAILAPACLSPIILVPGVGNVKVLSPFVLSPTILSPQVLGGLVLSPYALSPVIFSRLILFRLILSPSWLS